MKRYEHFLEWVRLLALFTAVFVADVSLKTLVEHGLPNMLVGVLVGLVAIASLHVAELLSVHAFERSTWLKRHLLGNQWVEGMWFDHIVGQNQFALVCISIENGSVRIHGEQFDSSGNVTATWEDYVTALEGNTLSGIYRSAQFKDGSPSDVGGLSTYVFTGPPDSPPLFYSGMFVDASSGGRRCQLRGFRIVDPTMLKRLHNPKSKRTQITMLMKHSASLTDVASKVPPETSLGELPATGKKD